MTEASPLLLDVQSLHIEARVGRERRVLVEDVSIGILPGRTLGVVGESGSGKSLTARAIMRLLPDRSTHTGDIHVDGRSVFERNRRELRELRRSTVAMVHQDPRAAINPVRTIGDFMTEGIRHLPRAERWDRAAAALAEVGITDARRRFRQYPHQLSGGLLQRVLIAGVLLPQPRLILADEPTTALDVTSQSEVMAVLSELQQRRDAAMLFITHDLDLAVAVTDTIAVMYAGTIVETGPSATMHHSARHPYTAALMAARPRTDRLEPLTTIPGRPVAAFEVGSGCAFAPRCPSADPLCHTERPAPQPVGDHLVACHHPESTSTELQIRVRR